MATRAQKDAFVAAMAPYAVAVGQQYGIDPKLIIAQSGVESNWGASAPHNVYFGVKGQGPYGGVSLMTHENVPGKGLVPMAQTFRSYPSMEAAVQDYGRLIGTNPRYAGVVNATSLADQADAMGRAGYANNGDYAGYANSILNAANGMDLSAYGMTPPADIPNVAPPLPIPRPKLPNTSGGPDDRALAGWPANYTPIPLAPLPGQTNWADAYLNMPQATPPLPTPRPAYAAPSVPSTPAPQTVNVNGHTYQVGQILSSGGNTYKVQPDGTFAKAPRMSLGTNTVASGIGGTMLQDGIRSAAAAAPAALGNIGSTVGGLFGNLFGPHPAQLPPAPVLGSNNGGWSDFLRSAPPPSLTAPVDSATNGGWNAYLPQNTMAGGAQLPAGVVPKAAATAMQQANSAANGPANTDSWQSLMGSFSNPPLIPDQTYTPPPAAPAAPTYAPKTVMQQQINPAYTQWASLSGSDDPYQNAAFNYAMSQQTAPPKYISVPKTIQVAVPPKPVAPPVAQPQSALANWYGGTPLGHITDFLGGLMGEP